MSAMMKQKAMMIGALLSVAGFNAAAGVPSAKEAAKAVIAGPACEIFTEGEKAAVGQKYRVAVNGKLVDGADNVQELTAKIQQLETKGVCHVDKSVDCRFMEEGEVNLEYKRVRIQRGSQVFAGADNFKEAFEQAKVLISGGLCQPATQTTGLASEGVVAGAWMKHRILIDGAAVFGANDMGTLLGQLNELHSLAKM